MDKLVTAREERKFNNRTTINRANEAAGSYYTLAKETFEDPNLNSDAIRLLMRMLNNTDGYIINLTVFGQNFGWSRSKTTKTYKMLEDSGYAKREQLRVGGRLVGYDYTVYETKSQPHVKNEIPEKQDSEKQISD